VSLGTEGVFERLRPRFTAIRRLLGRIVVTGQFQLCLRVDCRVVCITRVRVSALIGSGLFRPTHDGGCRTAAAATTTAAPPPALLSGTFWHSRRWC